MDRNTGRINTTHGPTMLLPDPRDAVIVRRVLSGKEVILWYPGNPEALAYNRDLAASAAAAAEQTKGFVSEAGYRSTSGRIAENYNEIVDRAALETVVSDEFSRETQFTPPRTVTLDTKFDGVPAISVWTGYAVQVVNKEGERKVVNGPANILLDYDESLEILELSTNKPKNTDKLQRTVYLRTRNNKVSDIVEVETKDHVRVKVKLSMLVNFEGEPEEWFQVENYVKLLCDHVRSVLKGKVKKIGIEHFYAGHVEIIRDSILGASSQDGRTGMEFDENGMIVRDVEILDFTIENHEISQLLDQAQFDAVHSNIELENTERSHDMHIRRSAFERKTADANAETVRHKLAIDEELLVKRTSLSIAETAAQIKRAEEATKANAANEKAEDVLHKSRLNREKQVADQRHAILQAESDLEIAGLQAEVEATVKRFEAASGSMSEALIALSRDDVLIKVAKAASIQSMIGGDSITDVIQKIFRGTPLGALDVTKWLGAASLPEGIKAGVGD
jgi:major vault protein